MLAAVSYRASQASSVGRILGLLQLVDGGPACPASLQRGGPFSGRQPGPSFVGAQSRRTMFHPPSNKPYCGIYRTDGDRCRRDDLLVVQRHMNYHPGANVSYLFDRKQHLLMANCDGVVVITREQCYVDETLEMMQAEYEYRQYQGLVKLTFNVIPRRPSNTFKLVQLDD